MESNEKSPIIDRLVQFIEHTGLSSTQFADRADIPRPTLSQMLHGRNKSVNNQMLTKLNVAFPNLNILWLLFGQGDMLQDSNIEFSEPQNDEEDEFFEPQHTDYKPSSMPYEFESPNLFTIGNQIPKPEPEPDSPTLPPEIPIDDTKRISSIIVLYTDGSFETFKPA